VDLVCRPADAYRTAAAKCLESVRVNDRVAGYQVKQLCAVLKRLADDIENGLVGSIAEAASAETLGDLLEQGTEYHRRGHKEGAGILATAVYEDTIRRGRTR
jgi:hypothetical protein